MTKNFFKRTFQVLTLLSLVSFYFVTPAFASVADSLKVQLTDSRKSTTSKYTVTLDQATGTVLASGETVTVTWPSGFTVPTFVAADATFTDNGSSKTLQDAACGSTDTVRITVSGQVVTFTACNSYSGTSGSNLVMTLGTGSTKVTNHATAASYSITVAGNYGDDSKVAKIAITDGVTLSATISETLTFTVAGANVATCTVTGGTEIDTSGDATTVPFGTVNSDSFYDACQQLTTGTNAGGGYSTTVQTTSLPTSGGNTIAKGSCDSSCTDSSETAWSTATNNGYGYCMDDTTGDGASTADAGWGTNGCGAGTQNFKTIANVGAAETAQSIMSSAASTASNDVALIGYRLTVGAGQAAGSYTTTIVYICTPTF